MENENEWTGEKMCFEANIGNSPPLPYELDGVYTHAILLGILGIHTKSSYFDADIASYYEGIINTSPRRYYSISELLNENSAE